MQLKVRERTSWIFIRLSLGSFNVVSREFYTLYYTSIFTNLDLYQQLPFVLQLYIVYISIKDPTNILMMKLMLPRTGTNTSFLKTTKQLYYTKTLFRVKIEFWLYDVL